MEVLDQLRDYLDAHPLPMRDGLAGMRAKLTPILRQLHNALLDRMARDSPQVEAPPEFSTQTVLMGGRLTPLDTPELWVSSSRQGFGWSVIDGVRTSSAVCTPNDEGLPVARAVLERISEYESPIAAVQDAIRAVSRLDPRRVSAHGRVFFLSDDLRDAELPRETDF